MMHLLSLYGDPEVMMKQFEDEVGYTPKQKKKKKEEGEEGEEGEEVAEGEEGEEVAEIGEDGKKSKKKKYLSGTSEAYGVKSKLSKK